MYLIYTISYITIYNKKLKKVANSTPTYLNLYIYYFNYIIKKLKPFINTIKAKNKYLSSSYIDLVTKNFILKILANNIKKIKKKISNILILFY